MAVPELWRRQRGAIRAEGAGLGPGRALRERRALRALRALEGAEGSEGAEGAGAGPASISRPSPDASNGAARPRAPT